MDTIFEKTSTGAGDEKELLKKPGGAYLPTSWSRDGRFLLYYTGIREDLWVLPLEGDRKPVLLLGRPEFSESQARFSPDMRWISYTSNESGRSEVYVRPFVAAGASGPSLGEGQWQISRDGGSDAHWRADGKELIFRAGVATNRAVMAVDVNGTGAAFQADVPKQLFAAPNLGDWDVTGDGKRFLMAAPLTQATVETPFTVVLNWEAALKK